MSASNISTPVELPVDKVTSRSIFDRLNFRQCLDTKYIVAVVIPLAIAVILYLVKPKFILTHDTDNDKLRVAWKSLLKWTVILTLIAYAGGYLYTRYNDGTLNFGTTCLSHSSASIDY